MATEMKISYLEDTVHNRVAGIPKNLVFALREGRTPLRRDGRLTPAGRDGEDRARRRLTAARALVCVAAAGVLWGQAEEIRG